MDLRTTLKETIHDLTSFQDKIKAIRDQFSEDTPAYIECEDAFKSILKTCFYLFRTETEFLKTSILHKKQED